MARARRRNEKYIEYICPCGFCGHMILSIEPDPPRPMWGWDGNEDRPTLHPSILHTYPVDGPEAQEYVFKKTGIEIPIGQKFTCHSFIRDGQAQFLGDCTHRSAGHTVDLPELGD